MTDYVSPTKYAAVTIVGPREGLMAALDAADTPAGALFIADVFDEPTEEEVFRACESNAHAMRRAVEDGRGFAAKPSA